MIITIMMIILYFKVAKLSDGKKRLHTFAKRKVVGGSMSIRPASQGIRYIVYVDR